MKKIVLFTRLEDHDDSEWGAWCSTTGQQDNDDRIEAKQDDITLVIYNGGNLLGIIPTFNPMDNDLIPKAEVFINKLWNLVKNERDPEAVVAIHFGGGEKYEDSLESWLLRLKNSYNSDASNILSSFNSAGCPRLTHYSAGNEQTYVPNNWNGLRVFYEKLFDEPYLEVALELLHACLTPDGRDKVVWNYDGQITIPREGDPPFVGLISNNSGKSEFETLKKKQDGPFGQGYLEALTRLRNELLKGYQ